MSKIDDGPLAQKGICFQKFIFLTVFYLWYLIIT